MCQIVACGFPFASEMAHAFPAVLGEHQLKDAEVVKVTDFKRYVEGSSYPLFCVQDCSLQSADISSFSVTSDANFIQELPF